MAVLLISIVYFLSNYFLKKEQEKKLKEEIKKASEQIRAAEEKYRQMFRENKTILLMIDFLTLKIIDANDSALSFYGYSLKEFKNKKFVEIDPAFEKNIRILDEKFSHTNYRSKHSLSNGESVAVEVFVSLIKTGKEKFIYVGIYDVSKEEEVKRALVSTEEKYRAIVENIQDGLIMISNFKIIFVNNAITRMLGWDKFEILGKGFEKFVVPEDLPRIRNYYLKILSGENVPKEHITRLLHKDGSYVTVNNHLGLFRVGNKRYIVGTVKDITQTYKVQKALEESEKRYRELFENNIVGIYRADAVGKLIIANESFVKMLGYDTFTEMKDINLFEFYLSGESKEEFKQKLFEEGQLKGFEHRLKKRNGSIIYVRETAHVTRDKKGNILYYEGIVEDITLMKKTLERLKTSEERSARIIEAIPDPLFELSPTGRILNVRNWGVFGNAEDVDDYIGESFENLLPENSIREFREVFAEVFASGSVTSMLVSYIEGEENSHFELRFIKIDKDLVLVLSRDVTEIVEYENTLVKAKEAAEKANKLKSEFLAQMSHEIRTPLNTILSFTQLIDEECRGKVSEELNESFDSIQRGGKRLLTTIELILRTSEVQAGIYEKYVEEFSLISILNDVISELRILAEKKGLKLQFEKKVERGIIQGDKFSVSHIFINLINNAIKYTNQGYIKVTVREEKDVFVVTVEDTGIGIKEEYIEHIFEPFSQEDSGYTRKFEGTGLGLSLVKKYVELNNGEIKVESEKGKGTVFTVILPKEPDEKNNEE